MAFARGTHLVNSSIGLQHRAIEPSAAGAFEHVLWSTGFSPFIVEIRSARSASNPDASWLLEPRDMLHNGFSGNLKAAPAEQWDAFLFIDEVRARTPLQ
jgi:erythromycin esterase-like protein